VKLARTTKYAAIAAAGMLALAACSDPVGNGDTSASAAPPDIDCTSGKLSAEGSSAQNNAMAEWIKGYQIACPDATVNYNPTGSGAGVQQFIAGQVDFAGSDSALDADDGEVADARERCSDNEAWNLPMVVGPVTVAYNLEGIDRLVLDAETAAKIFKGEITTWDADEVQSLNPDATLPSEDITVFYRSDESGTTDNFTSYLSTAAPTVWAQEPSKAWTGSGEGKAQSAGVQQATLDNANSISYMEWSFAKDANLGTVEIDNGSGPVTLSAESAGKALESAKQVGKGNDLGLKLDYANSEPGTYPIVLVTYEIVCSAGQSSDASSLVKSFLGYTSSSAGQATLEDIGYAPLPASLQDKVGTAVAAIS
jgi:phosphate transport system substrate-binding protein